MNKGLNSLCDSLVDWFFLFLLAFHRPESHAKFPGKWPYWHPKVCPKLGPCLCWGQRGTCWLSIKKEVNIQMSRRQMLDESGWTWGSSGALFLWTDVSQLQFVLLLWWFHAAVGLWGRGRDALLHVKRFLRNNENQNCSEDVCKGVELRVTLPAAFRLLKISGELLWHVSCGADAGLDVLWTCSYQK